MKLRQCVCGAVPRWVAAIAITLVMLFATGELACGDESPEAKSGAPAPIAVSRSQAAKLLQQTLQNLVHGPAFDAQVRETVWTAGREVVGVGTYEQAGGGTGCFHLQVAMHDGYGGKHRLQQISDGRLAWTRTEIAGQVSLRRVDVGRLDEWLHATAQPMPIAPRLLVGAWTEMLSQVQRDYDLRIDEATLKGESVWVITGELRSDRRRQIMADAKIVDWPELHPTQVRIAVRGVPDAETGFGKWLPIRMEFRSDPVAVIDHDSRPAAATASPKRPLITLIELYSIRPIQPPPAEQFRFDNKNAEVNIINETDRYIQMHGIQLTERERRQLRR